jgi:hypothetical protein
MRSRHTSAYLIGPLLLMITGCTSIYHMDSTQLKVIPVSEAISEPAKWADVGKELQEGKDVVFHIREGQTIPLRVNMALPMATLQPGKNSLLFTRDTYLLISRSAMRISPDGQRWADISDFKSQKALFGFSKGGVSVGFHATKEEGTEISVDIMTK